MKLGMEELLAKLKSPFPEFKIVKGKTCLLLIDMQKLAGTEWLVQEATEKGISEEDAKKAVAEMDVRIKVVLSNAKRILEACREKGIDVVHVKIEAKTKDCRDVGRLHKLHNFIIHPGSKWAEFFKEVEPRKGEIVLTKTCSGAFVGTDLDRILRNMGIETLILVGFYTDQCVETTARDAADIGYDTILIEDACTTLTKELHDNAIKALKDTYVRIETTESILNKIEKL